ncbi:MAG: RNA polymerase sigma factor [Clostridia bacterium]|nr:RNA polymerase sigma factor [Clostridia bacterium]
MTDERIVELYWQRDESAIEQTTRQYGDVLLRLAYRILADLGESEETVNDTYLKAWHTMPPQKPSRLGAFLSKITRELAIDRYRRRKAEKRAASEYALSLEELGECVPGGESPDENLDAHQLAQVIGTYLATLKPAARETFLRRYFYAESLQETAEAMGASLSWVKSTLHRVRLGLRTYLEKEGYGV